MRVLLLVVTLGIQLLVVTGKNGYERTRPDAGSPIELPQSFSFPSGHAATGIGVFGLLGVLAAVYGRSARPRSLVIAGFGLGLVIGASRVVLNVTTSPTCSRAHSSGSRGSSRACSSSTPCDDDGERRAAPRRRRGRLSRPSRARPPARRHRCAHALQLRTSSRCRTRRWTSSSANRPASTRSPPPAGSSAAAGATATT